MSQFYQQDQQRSAAQVNAECYGGMKPGMQEYWNKMAGPRFRMSTFIRLLTKENPDSIVDLGCGNGRLLREVVSHHRRVKLCGIDLSEPQIQANKIAMPHVGWHAMNLDEPVSLQSELAGRFEAVIASEIIEHLDHPETFLRNARIFARAGNGHLFLSTQSGTIRETERRVGHQRHFSARAMKELLRATGWEPVRVWNCGFPFHDLSKWWANLNPDRSMARFGEGLYGPVENIICGALRCAFRLNSRSRGAQLFVIAKPSD